MTHLSEALQFYYKKRKNRIVFCDKLTLNQLALLMWEKLDYKEIDPSVISRVINGERLFSEKQLDVFCKLLMLTPINTRELKVALIKDLLARAGLQSKSIINLSFDDSVENFDLEGTPDIVRYLRTNGKPEAAVIFSLLIENYVDNILKKDTKAQTQIKRVLALIKAEHARSYGETVYFNQVLLKTQALDKFSLKTGAELRDQKIINMSLMNIGGSYYVAKKWKLSSEYLEKHYSIVDKKTRIEFLRTLLLDYANLRQHNKFKTIAIKTLHILDSLEISESNKNEVVSLVEAMSRSLAILGYTNYSRKILETVDQFEIAPFFRSQVLRGKIFIYYCEAKKNRPIDKERVRSLIQDSKQYEYLPYKRHIKQISSIGNKLLTNQQ